MHLDLKPANVLVTFDGVLRIGDFGLATTWPAPLHTDSEGDRRYIGPEILLGRYDKPADIFSLGLMLLEMACNVDLPDNGYAWIRLRNHDLSDVGSLTLSDGVQEAIPAEVQAALLDGPRAKAELGESSVQGNPTDRFGMPPNPVLGQPPPFMADATHHASLDSLVHLMLSPEAGARPTADQILVSEGLVWVATRRLSAATVYEGNWGPADNFTSDSQDTDSAMTGVDDNFF